MHIQRQTIIKTTIRTQTSTVGRLRRENSGHIQRLCFDPIVFASCQFIEGEPTKVDYRKHGPDYFKCGAPTKTESPYCEHHHSVCYIKIPKEDV